MRCPRCRFEADEADCYCRHCGKALQPHMGFWYDHGGVLLLTLIVGPFSLITLWLSRKLSLSAKLALVCFPLIWRGRSTARYCCLKKPFLTLFLSDFKIFPFLCVHFL